MRYDFLSSKILKQLVGYFALVFIALIPNAQKHFLQIGLRLNKQKSELLPDRTSLENQNEIWLGLHFVMQPGWKIYWRSPGDAGFPPEIKWAGSRNLIHAELQWPIPFRFSALGLETLGYENEVVLPILAKVTTKNKITYLVCTNSISNLQRYLYPIRNQVKSEDSS